MIIERTYNIPLRKEWLKTPKYKRAKKAIIAIKEFLSKHMHQEDQSKIKLGEHINLEVWENGIKNPPHHIKINVKKIEDGTVYAELFGYELKIPGEEEKKKEAKKKEAKTEKKEAEKKEEKQAEAEEKTEKKKTESNKEEKETGEKRSEVSDAEKTEKKEEAKEKKESEVEKKPENTEEKTDKKKEKSKEKE